MGNFRNDNRRDSRGGGFRGRSYGNDRGRGGDRRGGDRGRPEMHEAVCDECGKTCQIPFKPSSGKPVYCNDCFAKKGGNDRGRGGRSAGPDMSELTKKIEALDAKLERILGILSSEKAPEEVVVVEEKVTKAPKKKKASKEE